MGLLSLREIASYSLGTLMALITGGQDARGFHFKDTFPLLRPVYLHHPAAGDLRALSSRSNLFASSYSVLPVKESPPHHHPHKSNVRSSRAPQLLTPSTETNK
ncbi:unnamed protein product [Pleuronectes platessa]|uniref:Uncharacterized protein n=1 Tax=Pleuronectes platessa TaxID=8262 RepID=A0A9N7YKM6_PLEPL|nr:unnamed protein product [Pleuronectes platessa]